MNVGPLTISGVVVTSIIFTGILLNFAGRGNLGTFAQDVAKFTTEGYGV